MQSNLSSREGKKISSRRAGRVILAGREGREISDSGGRKECNLRFRESRVLQAQRLPPSGQPTLGGSSYSPEHHPFQPLRPPGWLGPFLQSHPGLGLRHPHCLSSLSPALHHMESLLQCNDALFSPKLLPRLQTPPQGSSSTWATTHQAAHLFGLLLSSVSTPFLPDSLSPSEWKDCQD